MLSVIRELAEEAEARAPEHPPLGELLLDLVRRGEDALARTPDQLQVLKRCGRRRRRRRGPRRARARRRVGGERRADSRAAADRGASEPRRDPPGAVAVPLLHRLPDRGRGARSRRSSRRSSSRSATRCSSSATRARSRCTCTPTIPAPRSRSGRRPARSTGSRSRTCTSRRRERETRLLAIVPGCAARAVRRRRGRRGRRQPQALREPRAQVGPISIVEGGQTMNPSTAELLRAVAVARRRRGDHPPEQLEHRARRRACRRRTPTAPSRSCRRRRSRPGSRRWSRSTARAPPPRTRREMREAIAAVATGEVTIASRDVQMNGVAIAKGDWLGLADGEPVAGGSDFDDVSYAVVERLLERAAGAADAPRRAGRGRARRAARADRRGASGRRGRRPGRAGSRTTTCFWRPSRVRTAMGRPIRILLVEDNQVFREALELLLGMRADIEVVASVGDGGEVGRRGRQVRARGRADGLPAAGAWTACRRPPP